MATKRSTDAQLEGERCAKKRALTLKREKIALKLELANLELVKIGAESRNRDVFEMYDNVVDELVAKGVIDLDDDDDPSFCFEWVSELHQLCTNNEYSVQGLQCAKLKVENAKLKVELAEIAIRQAVNNTVLVNAPVVPAQ